MNHWFSHCHFFRGCIDTGVYLATSKKCNIIPVHKKGDQKIVNNYSPVSLLPICSKILEKIIFVSVMRFLNKKTNPGLTEMNHAN